MLGGTCDNLVSASVSFAAAVRVYSSCIDLPGTLRYNGREAEMATKRVALDELRRELDGLFSIDGWERDPAMSHWIPRRGDGTFGYEKPDGRLFRGKRLKRGMLEAIGLVEMIDNYAI